MISAVTGLPAIFIDGLKELEKDFEYVSNKPKENEQINAQKNAEITSMNEEIQKSAKKEEKGKKISFDEIQKNLQELLKDSNLMIEFSKDSELNKMIIKMIDQDTKEIIRQIPPDVTLKIARIIAGTFGAGQIADAKV